MAFTTSVAPRRSARVEARKLRTRAAILLAAGDLFTRQGYDATTMQEMATLADVGLGTMYGYFPSKEDVLRTVLEDRRQQTLTHTSAAIAAAESTLERVSALLEQVWHYLRENRPLALAMLSIEASRAGGQSGIAPPFNELVELLQKGQERGELGDVPAETAGRVLLSAYTAAALQTEAWRDLQNPQAALTELRLLTGRLLRV